MFATYVFDLLRGLPLHLLHGMACSVGLGIGLIGGHGNALQMYATYLIQNVLPTAKQAISKQLRDTVNQVQKDIGNRLYEHCLRGHVPSGNQIIFKEDVVKLKRCTFSVARSTLPPVCTHNVIDDQTDPTLAAIRRCKLFNHREVQSMLSNFTLRCQIKPIFAIVGPKS